MLHEVLLALLGHPGEIIQEVPSAAIPGSKSSSSSTTSDVGGSSNNKASFRVPDTITFLAPTERAAINRVVGMGRIYRDLRHFVTAHPSRSADEALLGEGLYVRALKLGVAEVLDEYAERVAGVERDVMADPTLTLARVHAGVREYQSVLAAVEEACAAVTAGGEWGQVKGAQLLEVLHERSHFGAPDVRRRLCRLVWHCSQVLLNQCVSWLLHGLLLDPFQEFFVQKNVDPIAAATTATASSGLSAGLDEAGYERYDRYPAFVDGAGDGAGGGIGAEGALAGYGDWRAEEEWNSTYTLRLPLVPTSFVPHRLAQKMLFVGKVVRVLRQGDSSAADLTGAGFGDSGGRAFDNGSDEEGAADRDVGVSEAEVLELTQRWSELRDRDTFRLLALERAVHQAHSLVDRRLYRLLVNVAGLEKHLSNLKGLFLMGRGALFHSLLDKAREPMRSPAGERAVLDLNAWLAAAAEDEEAEGSPASFENALDRARLDLDPPGFTCKAFHDLKRQGFCATGKTTNAATKASVCLCPGATDPQSPARRSASSSSTGPSRTRSAAQRGSEGGAGSLWYTSGRELPRGFRTSVAFRCDRPKPSHRADPAGADVRVLGEGVSGSVSFVVHNHRAALGGASEGGVGETGRAGEAAGAVRNSVSVHLEPNGRGGGKVSIRWNPHRAPMLPPPDIAMHTGGAARDDPDPPDTGVRTLAQAILPDSCGLSLGQLNYLMVDYTPAELQPRRPTAPKHAERGSQSGPRSGARLRVYVNDPGRSGVALLSADVDLWTLIEMGGGRAFVGVSAQGPWRITLRQWEFHLGAAAASGKGVALGPLGGVGSGPRVEEMLEAIESWSGLCLHYRLEWPLHLVLTRETMQTYNRLFRLLACVKRASLELDKVWPTLMQSRYRGLPKEEKAWLGPLWMLRARMAFFVSNLAFYLQVDVVEAAYSVLQSKLGVVQDFVSLQRAHQEYLSTLRAKCYLDNLDISQGLGRALRHVLRFCCLFAVHRDAKDILPAEVSSLQYAFQDEMKLLMPVLERLAKELAMRLDFNGHFSALVS